MSETVDVETAVDRIAQAVTGTDRPPYFFLVGAGISVPSIPVAAQITEHCRKLALENAQKRGLRIPEPGDANLDAYSHWFQQAYPHREQRQRYLRKLMEGTPLSPANLRLAHVLGSQRIARLVVTPNFDDHLPRALRLLGEECICCDHPETLGRVELHTSDVYVAQVHGSYCFYDLVNLKREREECATNPSGANSKVASFLDRILRDLVPLVIGYAGWADDVIMQTLKRRLEGGLRHNLYWFCYRREERDQLPAWLRDHGDVCFVCPPASPLSAVSNSDLEALTSPNGQPAVANTLSAQSVLERLIKRCDLPIPPLVEDPVAFLAGQLKAALQHETSQNGGDLYSLQSVVSRIEHAHELELVAQARRNRVDVELAELQKCIAAAQPELAFERAKEMRFEEFQESQLETLASVLSTVAESESVESAIRQGAFSLIGEVADAQYRSGKRDAYAAKLISLVRRAKLQQGESPEATAQQLLDVIRMCEGHESELAVERIEAKCRRERIYFLLGRIHFGQALDEVDAFMARFRGSADGDIRHQVVLVEIARGQALNGLGRIPEAEAVLANLFHYYEVSTPKTVAAVAQVDLLRSFEFRRSGNLDAARLCVERIIENRSNLLEPGRAGLLCMAHRELAFVAIARKEETALKSAIAEIEEHRSQIEPNLGALIDMELPFFNLAVRRLRGETATDGRQLESLLEQARIQTQMDDPKLKTIMQARFAVLLKELGRTSESEKAFEEWIGCLGTEENQFSNYAEIAALLFHQMSSAATNQNVLGHSQRRIISKLRAVQGVTKSISVLPRILSLFSEDVNELTVDDVRDVIDGIRLDSGPLLTLARGMGLTLIAAKNLDQGRLDAAADASRESCEFLTVSMNTELPPEVLPVGRTFFAMAIIVRIKALLMRQQLVDAWDVCEQAFSWLQACPEPLAQQWAQLIQLRIACHHSMGQFEAGLDAAEELWRRFGHILGHDVRHFVAEGALLASRCAVRLGQIDVLEHWSRRLLEHVGPDSSVEAQALSLEVQHLLASTLVTQNEIERAAALCALARNYDADRAPIPLKVQILRLQLLHARVELGARRVQTGKATLEQVISAADGRPESALREITVEALIDLASAEAELGGEQRAKDAVLRVLHLVRTADTKSFARLISLAQSWVVPNGKLALHLLDLLLLLLRQRDTRDGQFKAVLMLHCAVCTALGRWSEVKRDVAASLCPSGEGNAADEFLVDEIYQMRLMEIRAFANLDGPACALARLDATLDACERGPMIPSAMVTYQARMLRIELLQQTGESKKRQDAVLELASMLEGCSPEQPVTGVAPLRLLLGMQLVSLGDRVAAMRQYDQVGQLIADDRSAESSVWREKTLLAKAELTAETDPEHAAQMLVDAVGQALGEASCGDRVQRAQFAFDAASLCMRCASLRKHSLALWQQLITFTSRDRKLRRLLIAARVRRIHSLTALNRKAAAAKEASRVVRRYGKQLRPKVLQHLQGLMSMESLQQFEAGSV